MRVTLNPTLRMKRLLYALLPWMVITAAAAQTRSADVLYTHFDAFPTHGLRVGDECFVALDDVKGWGWATETWADTVSVKAEGKSFDVPYRNINGRQCLPLTLAVKKLGGMAEWVENTDTLAIYGLVSSISVHDGRLTIESTLQFHPHATILSKPNRLVLDLAGVKLDRTAKLDLDETAKAAQFKPNVVRLVIETHADVALDRLNGDATNSMEVLYCTPDSEIEAPQTRVAPVIPSVGGAPPSVTNPTIIPPRAITPAIVPGVLQINVTSETVSKLELSIPVHTTSGPLVEKPDASTLKITLPGVALAAASDFRLDSPSVTSVTSTIEGNKTVLTLTLVRPMGAEIVTADDGVHLSLVKPNVGDGHLAGKLIVVDAGHGGHDPGAKSAGFREKDLTLIIAKLVAEGLTNEGATVILTRKTDVFIPLPVRARIANENHADLFISNHINTTGGPPTQSGSIVFHHIGKGICRVLAESIDQELAKVNGLPNLGVWSDGRLYEHGFAVLRETNMPGVLIEYGFLNRARDRARMLTDEFQHAVAAAVVRGIKVYLGDAKAN